MTLGPQIHSDNKKLHDSQSPLYQSRGRGALPTERRVRAALCTPLRAGPGKCHANLSGRLAGDPCTTGECAPTDGCCESLFQVGDTRSLAQRPRLTPRAWTLGHLRAGNADPRAARTDAPAGEGPSPPAAQSHRLKTTRPTKRTGRRTRRHAECGQAPGSAGQQGQEPERPPSPLGSPRPARPACAAPVLLCPRAPPRGAAATRPPAPWPSAPPPLTPPTQVSCPSGSPTANAMLTTSPGGLPTPPPSSQRWPPLLAPHRAHKRTTRRRGGRRMRGNGQSRAAQVTGWRAHEPQRRHP